MCTDVGWAIPEGFDECRICKELISKASLGNATRWEHEKVCRGTALANRTCGKCGKFFPLETNQIRCSRAMRNHEVRCQGPGHQTVAEIRKSKGEIQRKRRAEATAKAKGKAKAKAKPIVRPKAKARFRAKAKAKTKAGPMR